MNFNLVSDDEIQSDETDSTTIQKTHFRTKGCLVQCSHKCRATCCIYALNLKERILKKMEEWETIYLSTHSKLYTIETG